jgi:spermidine synthase
MLGLLPVLMNPRAKDVCVICFGMGTTSGAITLPEQIKNVDIVELSPLVIA